jgi:outer membrane protein
MRVQEGFMTAVRRLFAVICAFGAISLAAQTKPASPTPNVTPATEPVTADTDKDLTNPRALRLSLDDALKTAVERNVGISLQRYTFLEAGESLRSTYGVYDWFATADLEHQNNTTPTTSVFLPTGSRNNIWNFGISQVIPTGGSYTVGFNNSRVNQTGGGTVINPSYNSRLGIAFSQPLLRNFGVDVTSRGIYIARNTLGINREVFRAVIMDTAVTAQQSYLNLVYARQFVDVVKEALFLARDQARITQIRIDVGASAPLDILQPRVQIATEDQALIAAVAAVREAEDQLRAVMHLDPGDWDRPIIPTTPATYTPMTIDQEQAVAQALQLRPEMHEQVLTTANRQISYIYARNQALPQVNLNLNYSAAGLAGTVHDQATGAVIDSTAYSHAISQVFGRDFPSYTFGVTIGLPVTNIGARAAAKQAEYDVALARENEEQTRQSIALNVRAAVRAIDTAAKEITASRTARDAAEQNVEAERRRYENGLSTNFQVLQIQQQLSSARASEIQALVAYNSAVVAYHRAIGDLLDVASIKIEEPQVNEPQIFGHFLNRYNWLNYGSRIQQPQAQQ